MNSPVENTSWAVDGVFYVSLAAGDCIALDTCIPDNTTTHREEARRVFPTLKPSDSPFDSATTTTTVSDGPTASLEKALSGDVAWKAIENEFKGGGFWECEGEPMENHKDFNTASSVLLASRWRSKGTPDKRVEASEKSALKFQSWFKELLNDKDLSDCLELDMEKVYSAIAGLAAPASDEPAGKGGIGSRQGPHETGLLDVDIIRLPDVEKPDVKIFRLKLTIRSKPSKKVILRSGMKGDLSSLKYWPSRKHLESVISAVRHVNPDGAWRVRARGNTTILKIRARKPKLESGIPTKFASAGFLSGPQVDIQKRFPVSLDERRHRTSQMASSVLESVGKRDHEALSLSTVDPPPDGGYAYAISKNLTEGVKGGPENLLTHLTQDVFLDMHGDIERKTTRLSEFSELLSESPWRFPSIVEELSITRDALSRLEGHLKNAKEPLGDGNPFVTVSDAAHQELPIMDYAIATFGGTDKEFVVYFRLTLKVTVDCLHGATISDSLPGAATRREVYLVETWERRPFPLRVKFIEEVESEISAMDDGANPTNGGERRYESTS